MNHASIVRQYLRDRATEELVTESFPFVTVSREAGAGGHTLAREIIRKLEKIHPGSFAEGWEVFDHKLCLLIAEDKKLGVSFERLLTEEYRSEVEQVISELLEKRVSSYELYKRIFEVVRILALLGKCVIVGRGGMCVTADMPLGVHVRLVAPENLRVERMAKMLEITTREAAKKIKQQDDDRHRLVNDFFGKDIESPHLYDAVFNTERLAVSDIADAVADLVVSRMARYKKNSIAPRA
ncbi:MAG: cytidylate kinase-like family protein [Kiritimatiellae bacterium]|nr:cytidylate kinase-like family protein [Kiritimatiellia bacterium]